MSKQSRQNRRQRQAKRNKKAVRGQPGYRNRGNRTGLDPMDSYHEYGYAQGLFLKQLFTGRLRTRNKFYLLLMIALGLFLLWPAIIVFRELAITGQVDFGLFCAIPMGLFGILFFVSVYRSLK